MSPNQAEKPPTVPVADLPEGVLPVRFGIPSDSEWAFDHGLNPPRSERTESCLIVEPALGYKFAFYYLSAQHRALRFGVETEKMSLMGDPQPNSSEFFIQMKSHSATREEWRAFAEAILKDL